MSFAEPDPYEFVSERAAWSNVVQGALNYIKAKGLYLLGLAEFKKSFGNPFNWGPGTRPGPRGG